MSKTNYILTLCASVDTTVDAIGVAARVAATAETFVDIDCRNGTFISVGPDGEVLVKRTPRKGE